MNSFINLIIWKKRKYTQNTLLGNKLLHKNIYIWHWVIISIEMISAVRSFCVMVLSHLPWFRGQLPQQRNNGHVMLTSVNYQLTVTNTRQLNKKNNPKLFPPKLPCCGRSKVKRIAGDQVLPCRKVNEFQHFIFIQIT